ncbi:MAG TPA: hypothetical protein DD730_03070 [Desulfosporosinus sp.]|jgi:hypothetical protein|nr:hypothetical protein [Desulfosporosinus sp.]
MRPIIKPVPPRLSQYGIDPTLVKTRVSELPGMTSVMLTDLFPDLPEVIFPCAAGVSAIRKAAEAALQKVDMSKIKPEHSVNILASHHGFTLMGGEPYAEMLKTIKDVVEARTGCHNIRLRAGVGLRFRETEEYIKRHGLDVHFDGKAIGVAPIDQGIPIETEVGTLYGLKKVYDADWIIHAHNSDVREVHFHRQVDRAVKPFGMSYARIETRSTYHQNLGPRAANFTARVIFDSTFVQSKFAFASFLTVAPNGIIGVDVDCDLYALNDRVTQTGLRFYGKIMTLFGELENYICALDFPCPVVYCFSAGVIYANVVGANTDLYDLDLPLPAYTWYTEAFYGKQGRPLLDDIPRVNPAIKMCVQNYAWTGYPTAFFTEHIPTIVVGQEQAELFNRDPQNLTYMDHAMVAESTEAAMEFAYKTTGTRKVVIFDGAVGGINVSESLVEELMQKAPAVSKKVDEILLPKWLRQRGVLI